MTQGCSQTGIAIAADHNFRLRPNLGAEPRERLSIFLSATTGQENSGTIDFFRQLTNHRAQLIRRGEAKVRRREFSLIQSAQFALPALDQNP